MLRRIVQIHPTVAGKVKPRAVDKEAMRMRSIVPAAFVAVTASVLLFASSALAATVPLAAPVPATQATPYWTVGRNDAVITARDTTSKVWADVLHGSIGETYYPSINVADSRLIEFIVVHNGHAVPVTSMQHSYALTDHKALAVTIVNTPSSDHYQLDETIFTNPHANAIIMQYQLKIASGVPSHYQLYLYSNPHLNNLGTGNTGYLSANSGSPQMLMAHNGAVSSAIASAPAFTQTSVGYVGASDGLTQLLHGGTLLDYATATGNIGETGQLPVTGSSTAGEVVVGYGSTSTRAQEAASQTLSVSSADILQLFVSQWQQYLAPLYQPQGLSASLEQQYWVSLMTIKASEDKTYPGAMAASLTTPWGENEAATSASVTGYHVSWVRDSYQMASALLAAGDRHTASQILHWFFTTDEYADGDFPQNAYINGTPFWTGQELDQNGFPVILAYQLGEDGPSTYQQHIAPALRYILAHGPWTDLDRWEEASGFSPNTMAVDIAALALGAQIAGQDGHSNQAALYQGVARDWLDHIESWTVAKTGPLSSKPYFVRISTAPTVTDANTITIANGGHTHPQNTIVDQGFLSLVRLGLLAPNDPVVENSLKVIDQTIGVNTPNGLGFYRYNHDHYGNYADGAPYNGSGSGGLWPVLDGERGEYDLEANLAGISTARSPLDYLQTMQSMAYGLGMIPEQVWSFSATIAASAPGTNPAQASIGLAPGVATGSAAPLNWAMAQYVRLAIDISKHDLVDQPAILKSTFNLVAPTPSSTPLSVTFSPGHSVALPSAGPASVDSGSWVIRSSAPVVSGTTMPGARVTVGVVTHAGVQTAETVADAQGKYSVRVGVSFASGTIIITANTGGGTKTLTELVTYAAHPLVAWTNLPFDDSGPGWYQNPTGNWFVPGMLLLDMYDCVSLRNSGSLDQINVSYDVSKNIYNGPNVRR